MEGTGGGKVRTQGSGFLWEVTVAQFCEYAQNQWMGWFKWVVQELYLHKAVKKIKGQQRKDALYFSFCNWRLLLCCLIAQSPPVLFVIPGTVSPPGSSVHGISQARILEWVAISFSEGSSWLRDQTRVSCIAGGFFTTEPLGKPTAEDTYTHKWY